MTGAARYRRVMLAGVLGIGAVACSGKEHRGADTTARGGGVVADSTTGSARATAEPGAPAASGAYLYVSDEAGNRVSVIDTRTDTVVATIAPGQRPRGIRVSPDGKSLIVAVSGSPRGGPGVDESKLPPPDRSKDGIAIVDLATKSVKRLQGGHDPENFDVTPDGKTIYVSNEDAGTATVLDVGSGKIVATVKVGSEPEGVKTTPDGKQVWVTSEGRGTVTVIDVGTNTAVHTVTVGKRPRSVVFTPDGNKAYVPAEVGGNVTVVDAKNFRVLKTIPMTGVGAKPMGSAVSPDGKFVYITNGRGGTVAVIDTRADSVVANFKVGARPWGIAVSADGKWIYTANGPSNDVSMIDASTNQVARRVPAGDSPWGVAVSK